MTDDGRVWPVVVALCIVIAVLLIGEIMLVQVSIQKKRDRADCQTAGYATLAWSGDTALCVGRTGDEWVAVPLADVRSRLEGR